jgi:hypothetical protein
MSDFNWGTPRIKTSVHVEPIVPLEVPCWLGSMFIHMGIIVCLGTLWMPRVANFRGTVLEASFEMPPPDKPETKVEVKKQEFDLRPSELKEIGSARTVGQEIDVSQAVVVADKVELPTLPKQVDFLTDVRVPLALDVTRAPNKSTTTKIKGVAGDGALGTLGALDNVTREILRTLEYGPTLVVWLFDKSGSMQVQRETAVARFDQIYKELGLSKSLDPKKPTDRPLLTSIVSFGKEIDFLLPDPTDDLELMKQTISAIPNDDSGVEMTFTAVTLAAQKYAPLRYQAGNRQVMICVMTDEVGEDEARLEECISLCKRNQIPVYVTGVPAPFGRTNIEIKYVDPDPNYDQSVQWIPVRQGPETFLPEMVQLNFTGRPDRDGDIYRLSSGFGPYCLTRLCYETGGIYYSVHASRERIGEYVSQRDIPVFQARLNHFFDPIVMKPYRPDYLPTAEYVRRVQSNRAKSALVQTAQASMVDPMANPVLVFRKQGEDESSMKAALDQAQRAAAIVEPRINSLYQLIKQGEKDREKLTEPRWRAGYDLALGRILAVKVRTEAYNIMLAKAKGGMKYEDPRTNVLRLMPHDGVEGNSALDKLAKQSKALLEGVAKEHRGTPWAMWAEAELKDPIGWKWKEEYDPPPPPPPPAPTRPASTAPPPPPAPPRRNPPPSFPRATPKPVRQNVKL